MERSILNRLGPARVVLALAGMALAASCLLDAGGGRFPSPVKTGRR